MHTQFITNGLMHLASLGVITNKRKGFNEGKLVASNALGAQELYEFLNTNPSVDLRPSDYVCDPRIISRHNRMVAINIVDAIDLTGQVAADAHLSNNYSGVGGINDFMKGTALAEGGKSILVVRSTDETGAVSRIRPRLHDTNVAISRTEVHFVVTEYGAVNLLGKSFQDRAMALISIAHPDFRAELFQEAKEMGLISQSRNLGKSLHGVYPLKLEETIYLKGQSVTIRPAKPVDERGIQEHFYGMEEKDVRTRFFHPKKRFLRKEMETLSQIDYIKQLTIVAVLGEVGFERVIGIGEYFLVESTNMAEVAFSVIKECQGMGLGKILIKKIAEAARENGISGLSAFVLPENRGMINLFKTLPYQVKTQFDIEMELSCKFDQLADASAKA